MFTRTVQPTVHPPLTWALLSLRGRARARAQTRIQCRYIPMTARHNQRLKHAAPIREVVFEMSDPPTAHTVTAMLHPATLKVPFLLDDGILDTVKTDKHPTPRGASADGS
jgi:hypothetical protein